MSELSTQQLIEVDFPIRRVSDSPSPPAAGVSVDAMRPYLTIRETAALLAPSTRTIHRYIAEGKLKAYRVAGEKVIRIKREDVEALLRPVGAEGQAPGGGGKQP
jgi:excisionase family DNA binding protein